MNGIFTKLVGYFVMFLLTCFCLKGNGIHMKDVFR